MHILLRLVARVLWMILAPMFVAVAILLRRLGLKIGLSRSADWIGVEGKVQSIKVVEVADRYEGRSYHAQMSYSYSFEGEYYGGHYTYDSRSSDATQHFAQEHPPDSRLEVRVHPRRPAKFGELALQV